MPITKPLLADDEVAPVSVLKAESNSPFVLLCDHASKAIPRQLGDLGLCAKDIARHIGWDIGALGTSMTLSDLLDAPLVYQNYSRLVIDCNRLPSVESSMPLRSESFDIPGNKNLSIEEKTARVDAIFRPYHNTITALLDRRSARNLPSIIIAMHSFTPVYAGFSRPWHVGVLFDQHAEYARIISALLKKIPGLVVGDNEPYAIGEATDYTVPVHAYGRQLPYVELEIRQDLITDAEGQQQWAQRLANIIPHAMTLLQAQIQ